jgi:hypothetical protein
MTNSGDPAGGGGGRGGRKGVREVDELSSRAAALIYRFALTTARDAATFRDL